MCNQYRRTHTHTQTGTPFTWPVGNIPAFRVTKKAEPSLELEEVRALDTDA